jgi:hypothetical protein
MNNPVIFLSTEGNCANNYYLWKPCQRQQESDPKESDEISLSCTLDGVKILQGDVKLLMDDIKELRPTLFPSVPRLLNRFYDKVWCLYF